ncbi:MAG: phosphoglucomutase/phosphomannomutase family protein [Limnochordia bacterium]
MGKIKFGTDGWRAVMCDQFTFANVGTVIQAIAQYLREKEAPAPILIGHDSRFLAEEFARLSAEVLAGNGIKALVVQGDLPTPVLAQGVLQHQAAGGIMFTASHNPYHYNGLKFIPHYGGPAHNQITQSIERQLDQVGEVKKRPYAEAQREGLIEEIDLGEGYEEAVASLIDWDALQKAQLHIIYDPMYGTGRKILPRLLERGCCRVEVIHNRRDAFFGGLMPEPTGVQLGELVEEVQRQGADLGLATDGDSDRFGVIDADGQYISSNQVLVLLLEHLIKHKGWRGAVVRTVATTHMLDALAKAYGLELVETPVGFKHICQVMREREVIIGGEESGGLSVGPHIPEKDGLLADLLIAELRAVAGRPLKEVLAELYAKFGSFIGKRIDLPLSPGEKERLMAKAAQIGSHWEGEEVVERIAVDGMKFILADGSWCLMRPSGTEPLVRVYLEAHTSEGLAQMEEKVRRFLGV